ncbi:MAG: ABC transporter permease [Bacteroidales bacterium]|nr:ABC transporter permease [Bacteroidales bacterium]
MSLIKYICVAIRNLPAKGHRNALKILTLGIGLAAVLVLLADVCIGVTTDSSYDDADRIYYVTEAAELNGAYQVIPYTSCGIAPAMADYFPQIECVTRFSLGYSERIVLEGENERIECPSYAIADTSFFSVLTTECLAGDLRSSLGVKDNVVVSLSMARKLYRGNATNDNAIAMGVIGKTIRRSWDVDQRLTVVGVYADYPVTSTSHPDMVVSMMSIEHFFGRDCRNDLIGFDSFISLVKIAKGVDAAEVGGRMDQFRNDRLPVQDMKEFGVMIDYKIWPYLDFYSNVRSGSHSLVLVLLFMAVALLLTSVLNYILYVISSTISRSREMALRKCLGCMKSDIYMMLFAESFVHTFLAVCVAVLLINIFGGYIVELCDCSLSELFSGTSAIVVLVLVMFILVLNTVVPSEIFCRIPIATVFRNYRENKRRWKQLLLAVEFVSVAFLGVMGLVITMQYDKMVNSDMGFRCDDVVQVDLTDVPNDKRQVVISELKALPCVKDACGAHLNPFNIMNGNNVRNPNDYTNLFNVKDGYYVEPSYFDVLDIPIVKGTNFTPGLAANSEIIVDELFAEKVKVLLGWDDVIGKHIEVSSHFVDGMSKIVGVMKNVHVGSFNKDDELVADCPLVLFMSDHYGWYNNAFVRLEDADDDSLLKITEMLNDKFQEYGISVTPFRDFARMNCRETLNMRNAILIGCMICLMIAILGLVGYIVDEVKLRQKEIAVRRVNGAQISEICRMFLADVMKITMPSVAIGCLVAAFVSERWQQQFSIHVGHPWWVYAVSFVLTVLLVGLVSMFYVSRCSSDNPSDSLRAN